MLIHVHSEISNMFILKGKSHFSGAVSFWRNLQSQRDRNILPKKKEVRHKFLPGKRSQTQRDYVLPTPFLNFLSPAQTKNESILKFVTNNKKFKIRFRCKRKPKSEIVSLQDIFFDKIYNRIPIMQQSSSDSYQINTHLYIPFHIIHCTVHYELVLPCIMNTLKFKIFSKTIFRCSWLDSTTMKWAISFPRVSLGFLTWVSCWTRLHWNEPSFLRKVSRGCPPPYNWHTRVSMLWDGSCNTARESNIQTLKKIAKVLYCHMMLC